MFCPLMKRKKATLRWEANNRHFNYASNIWLYILSTGQRICFKYKRCKSGRIYCNQSSFYTFPTFMILTLLYSKNGQQDIEVSLSLGINPHLHQCNKVYNMGWSHFWSSISFRASHSQHSAVGKNVWWAIYSLSYSLCFYL